MAGEDPDKEPDTGQPSLELPSIGLFRRRKQASNATDDRAAIERGAFEREEVTGPLAHPRRQADADPDEPTVVGAGQPRPGMPPTSAEEAPVEEALVEEAPVEEAPVEEAPLEEAPSKAPVRARRTFSLPPLGALPAALVTGVVVGLVTVALTWLALRGCSSLRGTSTCGNPGILLYLVVVIAVIYLGAALLRAWRVPDAGSTSFLGVALLVVVALVLSFGSVGGWVSALVFAVVGAVTYGVAHWVTASFTEPGDRPR